ncbi:FecR family protein [Dyadobacter alkalitolerans]|uniref:FecR family protein n=1 Tax=Dyadobacter alkalitolerans TaxID=492736 RepID=UPI0004116A3B|nr:FecR domain-containing protein [Dyadobacter alkalitolerans]
MKPENIKDLFQRFVAGHVSYEESLVVVELLNTPHGQSLYEEIIDDFHRKNAVKIEPFSRPELEHRFAKLEEAILDKGRLAPTHRSIGRRAWLLAASLTGLLMIAGFSWYFFPGNQHVTYRTDYGELKEITLPDGSQVVLNGHSVISFQGNWQESVREVQLDGEAYFKVRKTPDRKKFVVLIRNSGSIEVLGTEFNVNHRAGRSNVMLKSGKIRLTVGGNQLLMVPGELAAFADDGSQIATSNVNPAVYNTWTERKIVFENTSLADIVTMLRQTYNLDVRVSDRRLLAKKLSGTASIHDIDVFLEALSGTFGLTVSRKNNYVLIQAQ